MTESEHLLDTLRQLASLLLSEETLESCLERVALLTIGAVARCDAAAVSVLDGSTAVTTAGSDENVRAIEEMQYGSGQGPCLQAIQDGKIIRVDSMTEERRWPTLTRLASERGMTTCLALPLFEEGSAFGALIVYSYHDHVFDEDDERSCVALAAQASGPLSNMRRYVKLLDVAYRLAKADESRVTVATGVLMEREGCTQEEALELLRGLAEAEGEHIEVTSLGVVGSILPRGDPRI